MDLYVRALKQSGFDVEHLDSVAKALQHIKETENPSDLYIIDLMMPPGDALNLEDTRYGLSSGVEIHRTLRKAGQVDAESLETMSSFGLTSGIAIHGRLRQRFISVPVIILTSVSNPAIINAIPFDALTRREAKIEVLPFELVEKVRSILNSNEA